MNYPDLDPVALQLGPLAVRWYGLMYLAGFAAFLLLGRWRVHRLRAIRGGEAGGWSSSQVWDFLFYGVAGAVVGGRLGYVLFYGLEKFLRDPLWLLRLWEGGMSFHGGLLGVVVAAGLYARKTGRGLLAVADFVAPLAPLGLGFGRLGNFINAELPGRLTESALGVHFPCASVIGLSVTCYGEYDAATRHVSSLYQAGAEGLVLFAALWWFVAKERAVGKPSGLFLLGYGILRFGTEFFREPDTNIGFLAFGWLTMGQLLCLPMVVFGGCLLALPAFRQRLAAFPRAKTPPAGDPP